MLVSRKTSAFIEVLTRYAGGISEALGGTEQLPHPVACRCPSLVVRTIRFLDGSRSWANRDLDLGAWRKRHASHADLALIFHGSKRFVDSHAIALFRHPFRYTNQAVLRWHFHAHRRC